MQTKSRNGKFTISASDTAKTARTCRYWLSDDEFDEQVNVDITAIEGENPTLADLSKTVESDCFYVDAYGLQLLAKNLNCNVTVGSRKYVFEVRRLNSTNDYLKELAGKFNL